MREFGMKMKKMIAGIAFCLAAVLLVTPAMTGEAASKPTCPETETKYVMLAAAAGGGTTIVWEQYKGASGNAKQYLYIPIENLASDATITEVKSSNTKVLKAAYKKKTYKKGITITFRGFGTSTVSFKVNQGGKTYKLSCKYTFKKTPTPFTLKVGGKDISSKLKGRTYNTYKTGKSSVKFTVKPNKNVELVSISYYTSKGKEKKIKNGSTVSIPKKGITILISYRYTYGSYDDGINAYADSRQIYLTR